MFFQDYDRFYRHRGEGERRGDFHAERREISEPLKVVVGGAALSAVPFMTIVGTVTPVSALLPTAGAKCGG